MVGAYFVAASGMVILIFMHEPVGEYKYLLTATYAVVLYAKFGVAGCYNLSYVGNGILFDPSILGTTIGLCTASSRFVNAGAQPVAELPDKQISRWIFVVMCVSGGFLILFLIMPAKETEEPKKNDFDIKKEEEKKALLS